MRRLAVAILFLLIVSACGSNGGVRGPTTGERDSIRAGVLRELRPFLRTRHLHARLTRTLVSRRDSHFASVEVKPLNAKGKQRSETVEMVLVETGGEWITVVEGTDLTDVCTRPSPQPAREVLQCP